MSTNGPAASISPRLILGALAAVAIIASGFLNWADIARPTGSATLKGTDVPLEFLVNKGTESSSPSILLLLGVAAGLLMMSLLVTRANTRLGGFAGGALAIVVSVLYCVQVQRGLDDELSGSGVGLFDFISIGVYVGLAGGIVGVIAALMPGVGVGDSAAPPPPAVA